MYETSNYKFYSRYIFFNLSIIEVIKRMSDNATIENNVTLFI